MSSRVASIFLLFSGAQVEDGLLLRGCNAVAVGGAASRRGGNVTGPKTSGSLFLGRTASPGQDGSGTTFAQLHEGSILDKIVVQGFGVLGQRSDDTADKSQGKKPGTETAIFDPAGLPFILQDRPSGAGAASRSIYNYVGLILPKIGADQQPHFPSDVQKEITETGQAKFHDYPGKTKVVHVVGPNFGDRFEQQQLPRPTPPPAEQLAPAYKNAFKEVAKALKEGNIIEKLRLLPVSSGLFAGPYADFMPTLTAKAIEMGFATLTDDEKKQILSIPHVELCIFAEAEYSKYKKALENWKNGEKREVPISPGETQLEASSRRPAPRPPVGTMEKGPADVENEKKVRSELKKKGPSGNGSGPGPQYFNIGTEKGMSSSDARDVAAFGTMPVQQGGRNGATTSRHEQIAAMPTKPVGPTRKEIAAMGTTDVPLTPQQQIAAMGTTHVGPPEAATTAQPKRKPQPMLPTSALGTPSTSAAAGSSTRAGGSSSSSSGPTSAHSDSGAGQGELTPISSGWHADVENVFHVIDPRDIADPKLAEELFLHEQIPGKELKADVYALNETVEKLKRTGARVLKQIDCLQKNLVGDYDVAQLQERFRSWWTLRFKDLVEVAKRSLTTEAALKAVATSFSTTTAEASRIGDQARLLATKMDTKLPGANALACSNLPSSQPPAPALPIIPAPPGLYQPSSSSIPAPPRLQQGQGHLKHPAPAAVPAPREPAAIPVPVEIVAPRVVPVPPTNMFIRKDREGRSGEPILFLHDVILPRPQQPAGFIPLQGDFFDSDGTKYTQHRPAAETHWCLELQTTVTAGGSRTPLWVKHPTNAGTLVPQYALKAGRCPPTM